MFVLGFLYAAAPGLAPSAEASTGLSFLKMGAGARAMALGGAVVSNVDDASAVYWNPAALAQLSGMHAELMHNESFQDVRYEFASVTRRLNDRHAVGLAFNGVWMDQLRGYDETGRFEGDFGYYGLAVEAAYGLAVMERISVGVLASYLQEGMDVFSTSGMALGFGLQAREIVRGLHAGVAVRNLGGSMEYERESFDLPLTVQGGATYVLPVRALDGRFLVSAEARKIRDEDANLLFGAEYRYRENARLQTGYRSGLDTQDVTFGFAVGNHRFQGQYALVPFSENLGEQHTFSVSAHW